MIVVDTNIIAAFCALSKGSETAEKLWIKDKEWHAPFLWISEFRNFLATHKRRGLLTSEMCANGLSDAHETITIDQTHEVYDELVLDLTFRSGCTAYDCEFVALAKMLDAPLLTWDKQLLKQFPDCAVTPEDFLNLQTK